MVGLIAFQVVGLDAAEFKRWLDSFGVLAAPLFVIIGVVLMSICVPKTMMSVLAGALFGTAWGSGLMVITAIIAAMSNYVIGRVFMGNAIQEREHREIVRTIIKMAAESNFGEHLLIRLSPVPTMIVSYLMGACRARLAPYTWAVVVAMLPQILWVHSGTAATLAGNGTTTTARLVSIVIAFLVAVVLSLWIPQQALKRLREQ